MANRNQYYVVEIDKQRNNLPKLIAKPQGGPTRQLPYPTEEDFFKQNMNTEVSNVGHFQNFLFQNVFHSLVLVCVGGTSQILLR